MNRYMKRTNRVLFDATQGRKPRKRAKRIASASVIRWLICCLPVGLIMLWNPGCKWKKINKAAVSAIALSVLAIIICGGLTVAQENMYHAGGSQQVSNKAKVETYALTAPKGLNYSYKDENIIQPAVLITPEPTLVPETAFVNDGGKYFHSENCHVVKETTPSYYVPTLLQRGFLPCEDCAANELAAEYLGGN